MPKRSNLFQFAWILSVCNIDLVSYRSILKIHRRLDVIAKLAGTDYIAQKRTPSAAGKTLKNFVDTVYVFLNPESSLVTFVSVIKYVEKI